MHGDYKLCYVCINGKWLSLLSFGLDVRMKNTNIISLIESEQEEEEEGGGKGKD